MAQEKIVGYMQPQCIFCPNGHVMITDGRGALDTMQATCGVHTCEYYRITYKVEMPAITLQLVEASKKDS